MNGDISTGNNAPMLWTELSFKDRMELFCQELVDKGILFSEAVEQFENCFIAEVLRRHDGSLIQTAAALGIHRNTLSRKVAAMQKKQR